jgi:ketosteroid isomerase-like protein
MNAPPQTTSSVLTADPAEQRRLIDAFLAAAHAGDFEALVAVLAPDVVFRMDLGGVVGFATAEGRIVEIDVIADPEKLRALTE